MVKYHKSDLDDIMCFIHQENQRLSKTYNEVINKALEQYLGRAFDAEVDSKRIYSNTYPDTNQTDYYIDNVLIGTLSTSIGHDGVDFINNNVSFIISFTPAII